MRLKEDETQILTKCKSKYLLLRSNLIFQCWCFSEPKTTVKSADLSKLMQLLLSLLSCRHQFFGEPRLGPPGPFLLRPSGSSRSHLHRGFTHFQFSIDSTCHCSIITILFDFDTSFCRAGNKFPMHGNSVYYHKWYV